MGSKNIKARKILIFYNQCVGLKDTLEKMAYADKAMLALAPDALADSFNSILKNTNEIFKEVDTNFLESIKHVKELPVGIGRGFEANIKVFEPARIYLPILVETLNVFLNLYLSPEDKKKTIGFNTEKNES